MSRRGSQHSGVGVVWEDPGVGVIIAHGGSIPADGSVGYAPGGLFIVNAASPTAGSIIYENVGTKASANFDVIGGTTNMLPLAGGTMDDAANIALGTTTGTKIGTAAAQKIGFLGATPVVQQSKISDATGGATVDAESRAAIAAVIDVLEAFGLAASS